MKPVIKKKFKQKKEALKKYSFESNYHLVNLTVALFFTGNIVSAFYGFQTIIPILSFLGTMSYIIAGSYLIQSVFFRTIFPMKKMEYLALSVFGIGPIFSALFLVLNFYIHTEEYTNIYRISKVKSKSHYQYFEVDGLPCNRYPELCKVHEDDANLKGRDYVKITLAKGLFGYRIITGVQAVD